VVLARFSRAGIALPSAMDFGAQLAQADPADADGVLAYLVFTMGLPLSSLTPPVQARVLSVFLDAGVVEGGDVSAVLTSWFAAHPPRPELLASFHATLPPLTPVDDSSARASIGTTTSRTPVGHGAAPSGSVKGALARFATQPTTPKKPSTR
jgi:hypothetical protein